MQKVLFAAVALAAAAMVGSTAVGIDAGSDSRPTKYVILYSPNGTTAMKAPRQYRQTRHSALGPEPRRRFRASRGTTRSVVRLRSFGRKSRRSNCVRFGKRQRG